MRVSIVGTRDQIKDVLRDFTKETQDEQAEIQNQVIKVVSYLRAALKEVYSDPVQPSNAAKASELINSSITTLLKAHKIP